jgi:putative nucleotidyltransferase with HDIG domain
LGNPSYFGRLTACFTSGVVVVRELSEEVVQGMRRWFGGYVQKFKSGHPDWRENIELKEEHTDRVCREAVEIARELGLPDPAVRLAEVIALLHDVGRFEQYARYQTFRDADTVNHARLGVEILEAEDALRNLDEPTQSLVKRTILCHNRPSLPVDETEHRLLFARLLRDADKLDIWRVNLEHYSRKDGQSNAAIELDLPDTPGISEAVCGAILNRETLNLARLQNLNDFKILLMGWVYDINFTPTFRRIRDRRFLERLRETLPDDDRIGQVFAAARFYRDEQLREAQSAPS